MSRLVVINDSGFALGGATKLAIETALGAARRNWDVSYITQQGRLDPRMEKAGVTVKEIAGSRVSQANKLSALRAGLWNKNSLKTISDYIAQTDTKDTVYHLHNWSHFMSPSIFKALGSVEDRIVLTTHDFFLSCGNGGQYNYRKNKICSKVGNSASCILTQCDKNSALHKYWRVARSAALSSSFPLRDFKGRALMIHEKQRPFLEQAGLPAERMMTVKNPVAALCSDRVKAEQNNTAIFIGRISIEKGADIAARVTKEAGMDIIFAGKGPLQGTIEQEFDHATMAGFCTREELAELIQKARFLIMPGRWAEPFGLVAGEVLWSGLPVLISDTAFLADDIVKAGAGVAVDPYNEPKIIELIKELNEDDGRVENMSRLAMTDTKDLANHLEDWLDQYAAVYEEIIR